MCVSILNLSPHKAESVARLSTFEIERAKDSKRATSEAFGGRKTHTSHDTYYHIICEYERKMKIEEEKKGLKIHRYRDEHNFCSMC